MVKNIFPHYIKTCMIVSCIAIFTGCSKDDSPVETIMRKTPCRITASLTKDLGSRLSLYEEIEDERHKFIKSVWEEGDGFTIRNLNDNKDYTFILEEGAGEPFGIFASEDTPIDGDKDYIVIFPHTIVDYNGAVNYFNLKNPICSYNNKLGYLEKTLSMRHIVGDYRDILFNQYSYGVKLLSTGEERFPATDGQNFYKNSFLKINATNLPEDFIPIRLDLKVLNSDTPIFYETSISYQKDGSEFENSITLKDYPKSNAFEVYLPLGWNLIEFAPGSSIEATFITADEISYTTTKIIEKGWTVEGGKNLIIHINGTWTKKEKPNNGTAPEWEEIIK